MVIVGGDHVGLASGGVLERHWLRQHQLRAKLQGGGEGLVIYCRTTSVSAARATQCATYCHMSIFRRNSNSTSGVRAAGDQIVFFSCLCTAGRRIPVSLSANQGSERGELRSKSTCFAPSCRAPTRPFQLLECVPQAAGFWRAQVQIKDLRKAICPSTASAARSRSTSATGREP